MRFSELFLLSTLRRMQILVSICARGGSKGVAGKNIKEVQGLPLIAYSIRQAQKFAETVGADLTLSTDSDEIRSAAAQHGLTTDYVRSDALADDTTGKIAVMKDVLLWEEQHRNKQYDYLLDLDVTSPLRTQEDLHAGLALLEADPNALNLFSVNDAYRSPYYNMVEPGDDGYVHLSKKPDNPILSRQTSPKVYHLNASFYFFRRAFFDEGHTTPITDRSLVYVMPHKCFDLDDELDFDFLEFLLSNDKLDFDL